MDLKSGAPYWPIADGLPEVFPALAHDENCDVAIVGAGITGALIAHQCVKAGLDVVVLDKRDVGTGSTAASTALLQFELDVTMTELAAGFSEHAAALVYKSCVTALEEFSTLPGVAAAGFRMQQSLYYASKTADVERLVQEGALRRRHGIDSAFLDAADLRTRFAIEAPAALLSHPAAMVDPYRMAHALLHSASSHGARVFDRTQVDAFHCTPARVELRTDRGARVRTRWAVIAAGYESELHLPERVARNRSSYAFITEPLAELPLALADTVIWETARPYLYLRSTPDRRILIGGEDDDVDVPSRRDRRLPGKTRRLQAKLHKLLPELAVEPAFAWAGTFAETHDGLPWFGGHPARDPRLLFAMAYGGNGILFSMAGCRLLLDAIEGKKPGELALLFGFARQAGD